MAVRTAEARWEGTLKEGQGKFKAGSGGLAGGYTFVSRFEEGSPLTNPEELIGAAHAGCYSMQLNADLERAGTPAKYVSTTAKVHITKGEAGFSISLIELFTEAEVSGVDAAKLTEMAEAVLKKCIISRALGAVPMTVQATLK